MNFSNVGINFQPSTHASLVVTDSNLESNIGGALIGSAASGVTRLAVRTSRPKRHKQRYHEHEYGCIPLKAWKGSV